MRVRYWLLLALAAAGCIDLTQPPELRGQDAADEQPDAAAGEDGAAPDLAGRDLTTSPDAEAGPMDAAAPDLSAPADTAPPADAAPPRDVAADLVLPADPPPPAPDAAVAADAAPPRDVAPDLAPDLAPDVAPDLAPDLAPDVAPPPLVIDDFTTGPKNNLGSDVTWDHATCNRVSGEMVCTWSGGAYHDFIETLANWCPYDASAYKKFRFRMRTSVAGERVDVYAKRTLSTGCNADTAFLLGSIVTTTTMTTYELDLAGALGGGYKLVGFEFDPASTNSTQFIYDDLQLLR